MKDSDSQKRVNVRESNYEGSSYFVSVDRLITAVPYANFHVENRRGNGFPV